MVGQRIIHSGFLDVKSPASSSLARGWRLPPWKTRRVELVEGENGIFELIIYKKNAPTVIDTYQLINISDVTMVTSKTHLHAFEIISAGKSMLVLSGTTELESRDWIWTLRKTFWPHAIEHTDAHDKISLQLIPNADSARANLPSGVYDFRITTEGIFISLMYKCDPEDSRSTPVEPFKDREPVKGANFPLTTLGRVQQDAEGGHARLILDTTQEYKLGARSLIFQPPEDDDGNQVKDVMRILKNTLFRATNNLHDCIAGSKWTFDQET